MSTAPPTATSHPTGDRTGAGDATRSPRRSGSPTGDDPHATTIGTARLVRLALRRDRFRLSLWVVGIVAMVWASAASIEAVYDDQQTLANYAAVIGDNPASVAMSGPGYGFEAPTTGKVLANEVALWTVVALALMSIFLVVRHTRGDEEAGRVELVRSSVVGRHAPLAAAFALVGVANLAAAGLLALGLVALGFAWSGALGLAAASAAGGLVFAGAAGAAAQATTTSRGALGISTGFLGAAFVVRAVGDIGSGTLTWASPVGWAMAVRAFADERWWTVGLSLLVATGLIVVAVALESHRDHGGGLVAQQAGPARGRRWMAHPMGLAARLQRGSVVGWAIGVFLLGLVYGSVGRDIERLLEDTPEMADFLAQVGGVDLTDAFYATVLLILALLACGFSLSSALRLRSEETHGRAEMLLATATSRTTWALGSLAVTATGTVLVLALGGAGTGLGHLAMTGEPDEVVRLSLGALVYLPAVGVLVGLAVALFGLRPEAIATVWGLLGAAVVVSLLGEMLRLPTWVRRLSPFDHVPLVPAEPMAWAPVLVMSAAAVGLVALGLVGLRRRDLD